jgi:hypothetical protein
MALVGTLTTAMLLSACSGSGSAEPPTATHPRHHHRTPSSPTTATESTSPTSAPPSSSPPVVASSLGFSPPSNGKHSHTCVQVTGSDPANFVYYPVMVKATSSVTLDTVATTYADGVQNAGSWVAPSPSDGGTGMVNGWPAPSILTQSNTVEWSKRVPAAGAVLDPTRGWYTVFLHLTVYPDALPLKTDGIVFTYHEAGASHTDTWVDHLVFKATC